jgi:hypothetical protein
MGKRHHKRRAVQHIAQHRRDEVRQHRTIHRPLMIFGVSWAAAVAIIGWVAAFGAPANRFVAFTLSAALIIALLTLMHFLVTRVLPVSRTRLRRAPGISERGIAPGVPSGFPWPVGGIDVHLDDSKKD